MSTQIEICPLCGEGSLHEAGRNRKVEHQGVVGLVYTKASVCDSCGCAQASSAQVRDNQRAMTAFQKQAEGRLTGLEMREVRKKIGLTQAQASFMFGGGPNSFAKYEADDVAQSEAMDNLVRMAFELPTARAWLQNKASAKIMKTTTGHIRAQRNYHYQVQALHRGEMTTVLTNALIDVTRVVTLSQIESNPKFTAVTLQDHDVMLVANSLGVWNEKDLVDKQTRLYGEEENLQSHLVPKYSETDYDRHTRR
ncbi:type II toxin-antitoxin system MqsA family antitoxin [Pseudomonas sp. PvP001]|uniref:type II toxin-antitoxin system MqsA family antitoxin n=1 Tax=Pseudomonas sp. PvP001 TaxID=3158559 RepID=UPI003391BD4A